MIRPLREFVAFDLETTGLDRETDEILEIGAVKIADGRVSGGMSCFLKAGKSMSPLVEALTGITADMLAGAREPRDGLEAFLAFAGELPLVAHNAEFDAAFLDQALSKAGLPPRGNLVFDSLLLARVAWPCMNNHRLENLAEKLELPPQQAHRAQPDAEQAALLWLAAQEKLQGCSPEALDGFERMLRDGPAPWRDFFSGGLPGESRSLAAPISPPTVREAVLTLPAFPVSDPAAAHAAAMVGRAFEESRFLVLETDSDAESLRACLLSAARFALARGGPLFVSAPDAGTARRIASVEFPRLRAALGETLRTEHLKPPSEYLSPRKYAAALRHPETLLRAEERIAFLPLISWSEISGGGDIGGNTGFNHERNKLLWSKLAADAYFSEPGSPAHSVRERAARAHLVLVTHDLLLDDLALDFALLPAYENVLFLEAQALPERTQARHGRAVGFFRLKHILQALLFSKAEPNGLLADLRRVSKGGVPENERAALDALEENVFECERQMQKFLGRVVKYAQKRRQEGESKIRYRDALAVEFNSPVEGVVSALNALLEELERCLRSVEAGEKSEDREGLFFDIRKIADLLRGFRNDLEHLAHPSGSAEIFWVEEFSNPHRSALRCAPAQPGTVWTQTFFPALSAAVFASPALDAGDECGFFCGRMGLDSVSGDKLRIASAVAGVLGASSAAPLFVARFSPLLAGPGGVQFLAELLARNLRDMDVSAFVFFTGAGMLKQCRAALQKALESAPRPVLAQNIDGNRETVLRFFRQWGKVCLLGTEIFLDGPESTSVPDLVVVSKLPFPAPTEPTVAAALEALREAGGNPLRDFLVPHAVLKLKRELGRINAVPGRRTAIWILDPRLATEKYAPAFLKGLNREAAVCLSEADLTARTREFLGK